MNYLKRQNSLRPLPALSKSGDEELPRNDGCVQVYEGSKFFWRSRVNLDICIHHHIEHSCFELTLFDIDKWAELDRLYLSATEVFNRVQDDVNMAVDKKLTTLRHDQRIKRLPTRESLVSSFQIPLSVDYILARINVTLERSGDGPGRLKASMQQLAGDYADMCEVSSLEISCPPNLTPAFASRRRRTRPDDFKESLDNLRAESKKLNDVCGQAERLLHLSKMSVNAFQSVLEMPGARRPSLDPENTTAARKRWMWAVHKVIKQNAVQKTRDFLNKRSHTAPTSGAAAGVRLRELTQSELPERRRKKNRSLRSSVSMALPPLPKSMGEGLKSRPPKTQTKGAGVALHPLSRPPDNALTPPATGDMPLPPASRNKLLPRMETL